MGGSWQPERGRHYSLPPPGGAGLRWGDGIQSEASSWPSKWIWSWTSPPTFLASCPVWRGSCTLCSPVCASLVLPYEGPLIDFQVCSQFEGWSLLQLTSINQLNKIIMSKHTLPSYKIRFKPFFPFQTLEGFEENEEEHTHRQQGHLLKATLKLHC